ncbi:unnamed protein product, partial [Prorocentrum cordatum]
EVQAQVSEAEALLREAREARAQAEALRREAQEAEEARTQAAGADALLRQAQEARDRAARDLARARGAGGGAAAGAEAQGRQAAAVDGADDAMTMIEAFLMAGPAISPGLVWQVSARTIMDLIIAEGLLSQ